MGRDEAGLAQVDSGRCMFYWGRDERVARVVCSDVSLIHLPIRSRAHSSSPMLAAPVRVSV
jgi:hypothetical protein